MTMKAETLRKSILQYAIQGKLVPQIEAEEPARVLLQKIASEKQELIKQGKIKKEKLPVFITEDEKLFDIPDSWEWVRLSTICEYIQRGKSPKYSEIKQYPVISQKCVQWNGFSIDKARFIAPDSIETYDSERFLQAADILWNSTGTGTLGRVALYDAQLNSFGFAVADSHVTVVRTQKSYIDARFILTFLSSPEVQMNIEEKATGTTKQKELNLSIIQNYVIPLPPLEEQHRIVARIEELMVLVDKYEEKQIELEKLETEFPEKLKKSILQYAIQGKLVPQLDSDEPASVLLRQIKAEKEELIKQGKIKKPKPLPPITEDEKPFEIPDSWKWVRLGTLLEIARGGSPRPIKNYITEEVSGLNWIKIGDCQKGSKYILSTKEKIKKEGLSKTRYVNVGDFLLSNSMSFGRPYILGIDGCIHDGWLVLSDTTHAFNKEYLFYVLSSQFVFNQFSAIVSGAVVNNLNSEKAAVTMVPILSLNEQKRIVSRIEQLFDLIDMISSGKSSATEETMALSPSPQVVEFPFAAGNPTFDARSLGLVARKENGVSEADLASALNQVQVFYDKKH